MISIPRLALAAALPLTLVACGSMSGIDRHRIHTPGDGPRVLVVVAHPDDEIAFAATMYKTATHLDGTVDIVVVTRGDGGYKYSTLAEQIYRRKLTEPSVGRKHLPDIRRLEMISCAEILGVSSVTFLGQHDHRYTTDVNEVLGDGAEIWDLAHVRRSLRTILEDGDYDFVLTHRPTPGTHAHHKAATLLTLEALAEMPAEQRPVAMSSGGRPPNPDDEEKRPPFVQLEGFPHSKLARGVEPFVFDRSQKFGYKDALNYTVVVNWAVAAHKSQGTMQMFRAREKEYMTLYAMSAERESEARAWFERLGEVQFEAREYDENGR